jgi:hypothetical protein
MEQEDKLYAAKTVSWPGATPFGPPVCGPNPLRGFGGHARPLSTCCVYSLSVLPRTRIQNRDKNRNRSGTNCRNAHSTNGSALGSTSNTRQALESSGTRP